MFRGMSEKWFDFQKEFVDINRLFQDIRDISWRSLVCDRWEDRFRIPLLVSVISTLARTISNQWYQWICIYVHIYIYTRKKGEQKRRKDWLDEKSPTTDREQISEFDLERHESGRPCIRQCETLKRYGKFRCFIDTRVIHGPRREYHRWGKK